MNVYFCSYLLCFVNSLAPGRYINNLESVIFKHMFRIKFMNISCKIALRSVPQNLTNGKSTLVQVIAWCCQATRHYLSQCWPKSMSPYSVTRPQWVLVPSASVVIYCLNVHVFQLCFTYTRVALWLPKKTLDSFVVKYLISSDCRSCWSKWNVPCLPILILVNVAKRDEKPISHMKSY